jgi:hypothetical protein
MAKKQRESKKAQEMSLYSSYGKGAAGFWFIELMVMYKEETSLAII